MRTNAAPAILLAAACLAPFSSSAQERSPSPTQTEQGGEQSEKKDEKSEKKKDAGRHAADVRRELIARARVWNATDVATMDIRNGPDAPDAFPQRATVACDYRPEKLSGGSPKFSCRIAPDDDLKVKYGGANGEVYGEVAATRLLWALGFGADRIYPVKVVCRGCPVLPGSVERQKGVEYSLDPAIVERKLRGREIDEDKGWAWPELEKVEEESGGATRAERDAFKLLAVVLQHSDSKPVNQRLMCVDDAAPKDEADCRKPLMMINDLGLTFGRTSRFNGNDVSAVNLKAWSSTPVWKETKDTAAARCVGNLPKSATGTLEDPVISEAGRRMLAGLLQQLTDRQIYDLFDVARFDLRVRDATDPRSGLPTIEEWVRAFKDKREQIVQRRCGD
jgi:hypothetical protein